MNTLYLIRHGENVANLTKEFSHRKVDYSLTPKGVLQAQQTGEALKGLEIDAIYASPLRRAAETAAILARAVGLPYTILEELREVNVGDLEGQPPTVEAWERHNQVIVAWFQGQLERGFTGGENGFDLRTRFDRALHLMLDGKDDQNLVVVGHGGQFTFALPQLCPTVNLAELITRPNQNCSISKIAVSQQNGGWEGELLAWSEFAHLSGLAAELVEGYMTTDNRK